MRMREMRVELNLSAPAGMTDSEVLELIWRLVERGQEIDPRVVVDSMSVVEKGAVLGRMRGGPQNHGRDL